MQILPRLHLEEFHMTLPLIKHLIDSQSPSLCHLPFCPIVPGGTDHIMVRLGGHLVARFPRHPGAIPATQVEREWLPRIRKSVFNVSVPEVVHIGNPDAGPDPNKQYPAPWSILTYLPGKVAVPLDDTIPLEAVTPLIYSLIDVLKQIRAISIPFKLATSELPTSYRTGALHERLSHLNSALGQCRDVFDPQRVLESFQDDMLSARPYNGPPLAVHGDLQPANLILGSSDSSMASHNTLGCVTGVVDWAGLSFGDPAVDLLPAWNLLNKAGRTEFRKLLQDEGLTDVDMWRRGRAWALSIAVIASPYYRETREDHAAVSYRMVQAVFQDLNDESGTDVAKPIRTERSATSHAADEFRKRTLHRAHRSN